MRELSTLFLITMLFGFGCEEKPKETGGNKHSIDSKYGDKNTAKAAPAANQNYCEDAHTDLAKMMEGLRETLPEDQRATVVTPEKSDYVKKCQTLPDNVQRCLVVKYAQENMKTCSDVEKTLDPQLASTFKSLISGE